MSWTYSDWVTMITDPAAQLTRLGLHIQEVSDKISADVAAHGYSRQSHPLNDYIKPLYDRQMSLAAVVVGAGGSVTLARLEE